MTQDKYYEVNFEGPDEEGGSDTLVWGWSTHQAAFEWALPLLGKTPTVIYEAAERDGLCSDSMGDDIPLDRFEVRGCIYVPDDAHAISGATQTKLRSTA